MSNRWKVVGLIALVVLLLFAFTIARSCHRVDDPPREEDAPRDQPSRLSIDRTPGSDGPALHTGLVAKHEIAVRPSNKCSLGEAEAAHVVLADKIGCACKADRTASRSPQRALISTLR